MINLLQTMSTLPADVIEHSILPCIPHIFLNVNKHYNWHAVQYIISHNYDNINDRLLIHYTQFNNSKIVAKILGVSRIGLHPLREASTIAIEQNYLRILDVIINHDPKLTFPEHNLPESLSFLSYEACRASDSTFAFMLQHPLLDPTVCDNQLLRIVIGEQQLNKLKMLVNDSRVDLTAPIVDIYSFLGKLYSEYEALSMALAARWTEGVLVLLEQPSWVPYVQQVKFEEVEYSAELTQRVLDIKSSTVFETDNTLSDQEHKWYEIQVLFEIFYLIFARTTKIAPIKQFYTLARNY